MGHGRWFSHPLLNPCAVKTSIMVVISELVVMHMCSDKWVLAGGFRGAELNCPCLREGGSCRRKSVLLVGGWLAGWMLFS